MGVSVNSYYSWLQFKYLYYQKEATIHLKVHMKVLFSENCQVYGSVRVQKVLEKEALF